MALDVETGTGSATAESYLSVADADIYHANYGNTSWASADEADKEVALRKATRFLDARYGQRWLGRRNSHDQALDWPRAYVHIEDEFWVDANSIPQKIKDATAVMAHLALTEDIYPDLDVDEGSKESAKIVVGPIEIEDKFLGGGEPVKFYRLVDDLVARYITSGGQLYRG